MRRFLIISTCLLASVPAFAQQKTETQFFHHGTDFVNEAAELDRLLKELSMHERGEIKPREIHVSLFQADYMKPDDQFAIRLSVPDVIAGCYELSPLEYEASFIDPYYLDIRVKHYRRDLIESNQPHLDCPGTYSRAEAMIPLSKRDLMTRGTKQIRFQTESITEFYDLDLEGHKVTLKPQSMVVFKAEIDRLTQDMTYDMEQHKKVQLYVPMARSEDDLIMALEQFAQMRGLMPVDMGKQSVQDPKNIIVVEDRSGGLARSLKDTKVQEVGAIPVTRQVRGENGIQDTSISLTVFAKPL